MRATSLPSMSGAPQPPAADARCPPRVGRSEHCSRMVNEFNRRFRAARDEPRSNCGEPLTARSIPTAISTVVQRSMAATIAAQIFHARGCHRRVAAVTPGSGPRRPNAARALCEESELTETTAAARRRAPGETPIPPARPHFSSGPCAKPPGWSADRARHSRARPLAPRRDRQGQARRSDRAHACAAQASRRLPARHRPRLRHRRDGDGDLVAARDAAGDDARVGELRRRLGHRRRQAAQARRRDPHRRLWRDRRPRRDRSRRATSSSPGTARPAASACPTPTGSPPTAPACPSATRPRPPSRRTSTGRRSMSAPSAGRRRSAARPRTACSCSARARSSGWSASPRRGRCRRSSA